MPQRHPVQFEFDTEKAVAVIAYLASKPGEVTEFDKYKAGKLIYLADKYHLVRFGKPIVGGEYRALKYGPVPQEPMDLLHAVLGEGTAAPPAVVRRLTEIIDIDRRFQHPRLSARGPINLGDLSRSEIMALDRIIALHGRKTFDELKALTHASAAYERAWESRRPEEKMVVMRYEDFFDEDADAIDGAFEEMLENDALRRSFPAIEGI